MAKEIIENPAPATEEPKLPVEEKPTAKASVAAGVYIGPKPAPLLSNLPDDVNKYRADHLPERHRAFVIATIPEAKWWWAK